MRRSCRLAAVAVASAFAVSSVASAAYLSADFESDTVNLPPSSASYYPNAAPNYAKVIDSASTPAAERIGGAGNQSLQLEDMSDPNDVRVGFQGGAGGIVGQGYFATKLFITKDGTLNKPGLEIRLGSGPSAGSIGVWLAHYGGAGLVDANTFNAFDNPVSVNAPHALVINFDTATDKYSGTIDGNPLTMGGGAITQFNFTSNQSLLETVLMVSGCSSTSASRVFVDDIVLDAGAIPEPASMGLVIVATAINDVLWSKKSGRRCMRRPDDPILPERGDLCDASNPVLHSWNCLLSLASSRF